MKGIVLKKFEFGLVVDRDSSFDSGSSAVCLHLFICFVFKNRQLQQQRQQNGTSKTASQSESDNVSRSSQESGLSRLSKDQQSSQQQPLTSRAIEESNCDSGRGMYNHDF